MEQQNKQVEQVETEEQKTKRRVPKYYLVHQCVGNSESLMLGMFQEKKSRERIFGKK